MKAIAAVAGTAQSRSAHTNRAVGRSAAIEFVA